MLRALTASPTACPPPARPPACDGFVQRLLPGIVELDSWDHTPVSGYLHDVAAQGWDSERERFVELARKHKGEAEARKEGTEDTTADGFDGKMLAPVTTKAGGRVWSVYFAAPGGAKVGGLHAAYPCQLLVRYDPSNHALIYDAFDFKPVLRGGFRRAFESAVADGASDATISAVATTRELRDIASFVKRTRKKRQALTNMLTNMFKTALPGGIADDGGQTNEQLDLPPEATTDAQKMRAYGYAALRMLLNHVRWKKSACWRVRVGMDKLTAARVVTVPAPHPHGSLPPPVCTPGVEALGKPSEDSLTEALEKGEDTSKLRVAEGLIATGAELEATAVLVLDFAAGADAVFAKTIVTSVSRHDRIRAEVPDWTPEKVATDATRHYIVGDQSEIEELVAFLAAKEPSFKALLEKQPVENGSLDPALLPDKLSPSPAPAPSEPRLFGSALPPEVDARIRKLAGPLEFKSKDDVHSFLQRAGVEEDMDGVNPCLKAGLLNGALSVPASLDPIEWLDTKLLTGKCLGCDKELVCTARDALLQPECGGNDYGDGNQGGAVKCDGEDDQCEGYYITNLCDRNNKTQFETGKFHNHCTDCPGFGECIGDIRNAHCDRCGDHYFMGRSGFPCGCRGGGQEPFGFNGDDDDDDDDLFFPGGSDSDGAGPSSTEGPPGDAFDGVLFGIEGAEHDALLKRARELIGHNGFFVRYRRHFVEQRGTAAAEIDPTLTSIPTVAYLEAMEDLGKLRAAVDELTRLEGEITAACAGDEDDDDDGENDGDEDEVDGDEDEMDGDEAKWRKTKMKIHPRSEGASNC